MARIKAEITRTDNSVFVSVKPPEKFQQVMAAEAQPRVWAKVASQIGIENTAAFETPITETPITETTPEPTPTATELLEAYLPHHIEETRWGFYVFFGEKSRIFDGTTFVYHDPTPCHFGICMSWQRAYSVISVSGLRKPAALGKRIFLSPC